MKTGRFKKIVCLTVAAVLACCSVFALTGCSLFHFFKKESAFFTVDRIAIEVGERYDLDQVISGNTDDYELSVMPSSVASLDGDEVVGLKAGKATVTLSAGGSLSTLELTVTGETETTLSISASGDIVRNVNNTQPIVFTPAVDGTAPAATITWYVNDSPKQELSLSQSFSFSHTGVGEYVIKAECGTLSAEETVRVYTSVSASGTANGELTQNSPFSPITLIATVESSPLNPPDYIEWFVDDDSVYSGTEKTYVYNPTPGTHYITLKVNGEFRRVNDSLNLAVICYGSVMPAAPTVVYDNCYPDVFVEYNVLGNAAVEITAPDNTVTVLESTSYLYEDLFDENRCNIGDYIDLCATTVSRKNYFIRVRSLGDGGAILASDWSPTFNFTQLPAAAEDYISTTYYDRDYFITSEEEYVNLLEYKIISRPKVSRPKVSFDCYINFALADPEELFSNAFQIAATSGSYTEIVVAKPSTVMHTEFMVSTVNNPSRQTFGDHSSSEYATQLHAIKPHINYDTTKYRSSSYEFPIDRLEHTQSVTYSDELYLAAENNTRPVPTAGSSAAMLYQKARNILRKIVTDDMTDMEKAHAIYDWIMWQVTYDTPATEVSSNGEAYSAYYLEGVFGDGITQIGGVSYYPFAVCDGMSKAYSLMCNIEGIPCYRVSGLAGTSLQRAGGHAWNKVCVDGRWYVVDCTWGDSTAALKLGDNTLDYELGLHNYLFLTDAQADPTHFEPYESGDSSIVYAPETTGVEYSIYEYMTYNGVAINCEIVQTNPDVQLSRAREIATAFANAYSPIESIIVPGGTHDGIYTVRYEAIEIHFRNGIMADEGTLSSEIKFAVKSILMDKDVKVGVFDDLVVVIVPTF